MSGKLGGLLHWPSRPWLLTILALSGVMSIVLMVRLTALDRQLAPYTILRFEFAATPDRAAEFLQAWGHEGQGVARRSLLLDFSFIPAYAIFFSALTLLAARCAAGASQRFGLWLVFAPYVAGAFDAVENLGLLHVLKEAKNPPAGVLVLAAVCAGIKFFLLAICFIFVAHQCCVHLKQKLTS